MDLRRLRPQQCQSAKVWLLLSAMTLAVFGCATPMSPSSGTSSGVGSGATGNLVLSIGDGTSRTLLPSLSMVPASYTISGAGPNGASFSQNFSGTMVTVPSLALGSWTITVQAWNGAGATGTVIGSGSGTAAISSEGTATVAITVAPLTGTGTLNLGISWPSSVVTHPSVLATLTPAGGAVSTLPFLIAGAQGTYTASLPNGYGTLSVGLADNGTLITSAIEVVRIVAGQVTSGNFAFSNVNEASGTAQIDITQNMMNPLLVSMAGVGATLNVGTTATLTASVSNYSGAVNYTWYVNGGKVATTPSYVFGVARGIGSYRIDLTAFSTDGTQAGSTTSTVQVVTVAGYTGPGGTVTTLAGSGTAGSTNATGTAASFSAPSGAATYVDGNLYIADTTNNMIRQLVIATGVVTTLAGSTTAGSANATGTAASFKAPAGIATDGINLYVADTGNNMIRQIVISTGVVTTLAGSTKAGVINSTGTTARFRGPTGVATDGVNVFVADAGNNLIRQIVIGTTAVTTLAGSGTAGSVNGTGTAASFNAPTGITTDGANLYVADKTNNLIRSIVINTGVVTTLAGSGTVGSTNGTGTAARFSGPTGVTTDQTNLYVADKGSNMIRKIVISTGVVTTLAGSGTAGSTNGTGTAARFNAPGGVATDGLNVYVADTGGNLIRKIQ